MSEPIDFKTSVSVSGTSHTAEIPGPVAEDDLITVAYAFGAIPGTFTPPTGYTAISLSDNTDGSAAALYLCYKLAGVGGETSIPAATFSSAQPCTMGVAIWTDVDTSSPIGNVGDSQGVQVYADTPALTTTVDNSSIWHVCGFDQGGAGRLLSGGKLLALNSDQSTEGISMSYGFKKTAGATTPAKYKCSDNNIFASIEIKDSGTGACLPHMDTSTPMKLINGSNTVSRSATSVLTTLNGKTCDDDADGTMRASIGVSTGGWFPLSEAVQRTEIFSTMTLDRYAIVDYTFSDVDLTDNPHVLFAIGPNINEKFTGTVSAGGVLLGVYSQRGDAGQAYRAWTISGRDEERFRESRDIDINIIDISDTSEMFTSSGTFDITKVDGYFIAVLNDLAHTPDIEWIYREQVYAVTPLQFIGGDASNPITVSSIFSLVEKCFAGQGELQGTSQGIARFPLVIGDNSTACVTNLSGSSIEFEAARYAGTFKHYEITDNFLGLTMKAVSGCDPDYSNMVIKGVTPYHWKIHSSANASANWNFSGHQVIGPGETEINVIEHDGVTFSGRSSITMGTGGSLANCVIDSHLATYVFTITSQSALTALGNTTFTNCNVCIKVNVSSGVTTLNFAQVFGATNTYAVEYTNNHDIEFTRSGDCDLTLLMVNETGAGTVTLNTDLVVNITAPNLIDDTRVQVVDMTNGGTLTSITRVSTTATAIKTAHGFATGQSIVHLGAEQGEYNGLFSITVTDADTYTFTVSGTPTTPATGTITARRELDNSVVSGGSGYSLSYTHTGSNITVRMRACYASAGTAYIPLNESLLVTTAGVSMLKSQTLDEEHNDYGLDGSTVTEITADYDAENNVNVFQIQVDDPDNGMDCRRGVSWFRYITTTEQGIREFDPEALQYDPDIRNITITPALRIKNADVSNPLIISQGLWRNADDSLIYDTSGGSIYWSINDRVYQGPETGTSGLTGAESTRLFATATSTAVDAVPAAVLAAAATTPIHADAKKMNGATIQGDGTDGNLWRG